MRHPGPLRRLLAAPSKLPRFEARSATAACRYVPGMGEVTIEPASPHIPEGLATLSEAAAAERVRIVRVVIERWVDGEERFDAVGERLLVAVADGEVVGVGGLSQCPDIAGALRMRRFYVHPAWRRRGVARALAEALVASGFEHSDVLTCNAGATAAAAPFWEALGFDPVAQPGITHRRRRQSRDGHVPVSL